MEWDRLGKQNFLLGPWEKKSVTGEHGLFTSTAANKMDWGPIVISHREAMLRGEENKEDLFSSRCLSLVTLVS